MKKFFNAIWNYLKNWKNLLGHTLLGIGIVVVSAILPIPVWARILVFIVLVVFNIFREKLFIAIRKKRNPETGKDQNA